MIIILNTVDPGVVGYILSLRLLILRKSCYFITLVMLSHSVIHCRCYCNLCYNHKY